ncbi:MAG TPA: metallophosphoesterase family protein [Stellaceae bacterium]|jgi:serine/threonine protein phosphatase 1
MIADAPLPERGRLYVIGDIHGRADLLDGVIERIRRDLAVRPIGDAVTVTLGDYVDRGPDSRGVLERLSHNPFPTEYLALKGNHEELVTAFLADASVAEHWRHYGGLETLHSYGVPVNPLMRGRDYETAAEAFDQALPASHRDFLASLRTSLIIGRYFLCHAGIRPGVPLERQSDEDLRWIREPFLESTMNFGKIVVHGHTPTERPEVLPNRINLDTGAYMTGRLTCAALEGERVRFLT